MLKRSIVFFKISKPLASMNPEKKLQTLRKKILHKSQRIFELLRKKYCNDIDFSIAVETETGNVKSDSHS